ncbi:hypothetical protein B6S44_14765 [Bosea sp. Tri-44]|uniref:hypothetical protein n=1 Tax=Bosea sp. Tri-44 TaxID=1972137 RepID=UPI00100EE237|nr:hypothetical protein [Bosea sp. Tri-44]RXT54861.1 hypothetical protein B6S44_14765 [Bosea sp. Tri-44]
MIRFKTIEPKPAANTNKPVIAPQTAVAPTEPVPAGDDRKIAMQRLRDPEKSANLPSAEKLEHD